MFFHAVRITNNWVKFKTHWSISCTIETHSPKLVFINTLHGSAILNLVLEEEEENSTTQNDNQAVWEMVNEYWAFKKKSNFFFLYWWNEFQLTQGKGHSNTIHSLLQISFLFTLLPGLLCVCFVLFLFICCFCCCCCFYKDGISKYINENVYHTHSSMLPRDGRVETSSWPNMYMHLGSKGWIWECVLQSTLMYSSWSESESLMIPASDNTRTHAHHRSSVYKWNPST